MPSIFDSQTRSQMLAAYNEENYRDQEQRERAVVTQEHIRHNQQIEELDKQRIAIAQMQADAKMQAEQLKIKSAEQQAKDIQGATAELGKLDPQTQTYEAKLAEIRGQYPAAFLPSKNGLEGSLLDYVKHLDTRNEQWATALKQQNEQKLMFEREHGITVPNKDDGTPDFEAAQKNLDARMKTNTPAGLNLSEQTVDSSGKVTQRFTPPKPGVPKSVTMLMDDITGKIAGNQSDFATASEKDKPGLVSQYKALVAQRDALTQDFGGAQSPAPQATTQAQQAIAQQTQGPDATAAITPQPTDGQDALKALAQQALTDPAASDEHKDAARKILGQGVPNPVNTATESTQDTPNAQ